MTFEEWYKETFPGDYNLAILAKSPPAVERHNQAKAAWEAGFQAGQDHQRELERLAEYDRSVFGTSEYSKDW